MSAILVVAKIATEIKTLSTREQWPDSAISQLAILLARVLWLTRLRCQWNLKGNPSQPMVYEKFGQSFRWRHWAEGAGACPSGDNVGLPILGLGHSLWPEWTHGITSLR